MTDFIFDENIEIHHDSEVAKEAAEVARGLLAARLTGVDAALGMPVSEVVRRVMSGQMTRESHYERSEFLACLLSSLCSLASAAAASADGEHSPEPLEDGTTLAAVLKAA